MLRVFIAKQGGLNSKLKQGHVYREVEANEYGLGIQTEEGIVRIYESELEHWLEVCPVMYEVECDSIRDNYTYQKVHYIEASGDHMSLVLYAEHNALRDYSRARVYNRSLVKTEDEAKALIIKSLNARLAKVQKVLAETFDKLYTKAS